jgi:hypothetical protein
VSSLPVIDLILYFLPVIGLTKKGVMMTSQRISASSLPLFDLTPANKQLKSQAL